jgi:uncharacterized protein YbjT (DUF2867 family)
MIVVIGATGNVGRCLVDRLCAAGQRPRIVVRDERKAASWQGRVETVVGDVRDAATLERAFSGALRLFCLSFIEEPPEVDRGVIDAARDAGVGHVVKLSTIGATSEVPIGRMHREREDWIRASGMAWTFLRPGFFMTNTLRWADMIKADGRVVTPAADGMIAPIAEQDIAEAAALSLMQPGHDGQIYELTGDQLISARGQVEILARVLDRPITCVDADIASAIRRMSALDAPPWLLESLRAMWTDVSAGRGAQRTTTFDTLTGHKPIDFEAWCHEHRSAFTSSCLVAWSRSPASPPTRTT